jgi:glycosyltransferase involved in cell wall biosynthesis
MKCSLLVANYNSENFVDEFIKSVFQQNYHNWELIVVDDCSTDNSLSAFLTHTSDTKIKVFSNSTNKGVGYTKRRAANLASGDILMFVDPDDALVPDALNVMVKQHVIHQNAALVYSTFYNCDENLNVIGEAKWVGSITKPSTNLHVDKISHLASFKKDYYNNTSGINPCMKAAVDKDLYFKLEEVGEVVFIDKPLYYYRKNKNGVSQLKNSVSASEFNLSVIKEAYHRRKISGFPNIGIKEIRKREAIHFHNIATLYAVDGKQKMAYSALIKSIIRDPIYKYSQKLKILFLFYYLKNIILKFHE